MACERTLNFHSGTAERTTIFFRTRPCSASSPRRLPRELKEIELKIDIAKHYHRPSSRLPASGQNFLLDPSVGTPQELSDDDLFRALPISFCVFRIYSKDHLHDAILIPRLNAVLGEPAMRNPICSTIATGSDMASILRIVNQCQCMVESAVSTLAVSALSITLNHSRRNNVPAFGRISQLPLSKRSRSTRASAFKLDR